MILSPPQTQNHKQSPMALRLVAAALDFPAAYKQPVVQMLRPCFPNLLGDSFKWH